jgi:hypothetical protein
LRLTWFLAVPFLLLARPEPRLVLLGAGVAVPGLLLRAWAAGCVHKDVVLCTRGPYALLRHPLYAGTFLLGLGLATASGRLVVFAPFPFLFLWTYGRTVRAEERNLARRFGTEYADYRTRVPAFLPFPSGGRRGGDRNSSDPLRRLSGPFFPGAPPEPASRHDRSRPFAFRWRLYRRNREWEALLGVVGGFGLLALKMALVSP